MTAIVNWKINDATTVIELPFDMSDDDFFRFCQLNRDLKFERDPDGKIIVMSPSGFKTGNFNAKVVAKLFAWNDEKELGEVGDSSTGFYLPNGAMRAPDASWVSHERLEGLTDEQLEKFPYVCPEFVIEILSPSDGLKKAKAKMVEYIANGVLLGWLVDRKKEQVFIYRADGSVTHRKTFAEPLAGEDVLPGFELNLSTFK
jgi:Uma2 family endonuclease